MYFQVEAVWARVMSSGSSSRSGEGSRLLSCRWGGRVSTKLKRAKKMGRGFVKILEYTNTIVPVSRQKRSIRASKFNDVSMVMHALWAPWHSSNAPTKQSQHWNSPKKQSQHCYLVCLVDLKQLSTTMSEVYRITHRLGLETLLSKKKNKNMVHIPRDMKSTKVNPRQTRNVCAYYTRIYIYFLSYVRFEEENIAS